MKDFNGIPNWKDLNKKERIEFLVTLGISKKEAYEIYSDNVSELPKEIKEILKK